MPVSYVQRSADNNYANNKLFVQIRRHDCKASVITYKSTQSLIEKIGRVVLAILLVIATLGLALCFSQGRKLMTSAVNHFKQHTIVVEQNKEEEEALLNPNVILTDAYKGVFSSNQMLPTQNPTLPLLQMPTPAQTTPIAVLPVSPATPVVISPNPAPMIMPTPAQKFTPQQTLEYVKNNILQDHPDWDISGWTNVPLEDQVWLLELCVLRRDFHVSSFWSHTNNIFESSKLDALVPTHLIPKVLLAKASIAQDLQSTRCVMSYHDRKLYRIPEILAGCACLEEIEIDHFDSGNNDVDFKILPNLKKIKFKSASFFRWPIVAANINLQELIFNKCRFNQKTPPDFSANVALTDVYISEMQEEFAFDFKKNAQLKVLAIRDGKLTKVPALPNDGRGMKLITLSGNSFDASSLAQLADLKSKVSGVSY